MHSQASFYASLVLDFSRDFQARNFARQIFMYKPRHFRCMVKLILLASIDR